MAAETSNADGSSQHADGDADEPTGQLERAGDELPSQLSDDYYVTLQPLTLDLIAVQMERIGMDFTRHPDRIEASWAKFLLSVRLLSEGMLSVRATSRQPYPAASTTALAGRCNWWNASQTFMKASAVAGLGWSAPSGEGDERRPVPLAQLYLDLDIPLTVGVAPVQLQSLFMHIFQNVEQFETRARLEELILRTSW